MTSTTGATDAHTQMTSSAPAAAGVGQPLAALRTPLWGASLGNNAKRPALQQNQGFQSYPTDLQWTSPNVETGEITPYSVGANRKRQAVAKIYKTPQQVRGERWALKAVASELLHGTRVCKCHRIRAKQQSVRVMLEQDSGKAFYAGLQTCGSVWGCPLCAAKISERRRKELKKAIKQAKQLGLQVMLLTLTIPHGLGDDVNAITDQMIAAWDSIKRNKAGRTIRDKVGLVGTIRAIEVTHGLHSKVNNGFHPHFHILLFIESSITPSEVQALYTPLWQSACVKQGLPRPSDTRGCKVDDGSWADRYASKWGLESEMTKGHIKEAKEKGMTPWDMLRAVLHDNDEQAAKLFKVYYEAFKGRRQLCWSKGLKKMLDVADLTDEEIAAQDQEKAFELSSITAEQWRHIIKRKLESAVLDVAERDPTGFKDFLRQLCPEPDPIDGIKTTKKNYQNTVFDATI